jgi:hypothetical protein
MVVKGVPHTREEEIAKTRARNAKRFGTPEPAEGVEERRNNTDQVRTRRKPGMTHPVGG